MQWKKENWNLLGISSVAGSGQERDVGQVEKLRRCIRGFGGPLSFLFLAARTVVGVSVGTGSYP